MSTQVEIPATASARERAALQRTRRVAQLLDEAFRVPGTNYRIGLDPIIGILPVSGDLATGLVGLYITVEAALAGVPAAVLVRMLVNLLLDVAIGSIPVLGGLFDAVWKANLRNVRLFEKHVGVPQ